jgi:hypothetical protein
MAPPTVEKQPDADPLSTTAAGDVQAAEKTDAPRADRDHRADDDNNVAVSDVDTVPMGVGMAKKKKKSKNKSKLKHGLVSPPLLLLLLHTTATS